LGHPTLVVLAFAAGIVFFGYHARRFRLDASSDSLVLENDADLKYYEQTRQLFGSDDYIVLAFSLGRPVLDDDVLRSLRALSDELEKIPAVESVNSILTVPLFQSPKVSLYDMGTKHTTLEMPACDRRLRVRRVRRADDRGRHGELHRARHRRLRHRHPRLPHAGPGLAVPRAALGAAAHRDLRDPGRVPDGLPGADLLGDHRRIGELL